MAYPDDRAAHADVMMASQFAEDRRRRQSRFAHNVHEDDADEADDANWDEVVDVICTGRGRLVAAVAAAAERAGLDVMLADGPAADAGSDPEHLDAVLGITDEETVAYLRALTADFTPLPAVEADIVTRVVDGPLRPELPKRPIGTFDGATLRDWGMACVSSPYGVLYTRVFDPVVSASYAGVDGPVEAAVLDTIDIDPDRATDSVERWLTSLEGTPDGVPVAAGSFQRLVFDNGLVVGAVVESPTGARTVRARHGVMLSFGDGVRQSGNGADLNLRETAQVALVSRTASRFARLELLTLP
ncbi:hypothetical protein [Mycolicibacterium mengxianglii]|uniref:hypothetical protein n=1 Tax=Mycolicibacterium mengxianglii TaxID=2736649 RepID=UPI0018EF14B6|nr:hypothetical protein [Mycolicibacterium mengxianglii]